MDLHRLLHGMAHTGRVSDIGGDDRGVMIVGTDSLTSGLQSILRAADYSYTSARLGQNCCQKGRGEVAAGSDQGDLSFQVPLRRNRHQLFSSLLGVPCQ